MILAPPPIQTWSAMVTPMPMLSRLPVSSSGTSLWVTPYMPTWGPIMQSSPILMSATGVSQMTQSRLMKVVGAT